jgi:hypothetical protein
MSQSVSLSWEPPGPVANAFFHQTGPVGCLEGPIGGGKTVTVLTKNIYRASRQNPSRFDGWRKFKLAVVQKTYRQLWRSTIPSWWKRVPQSTGDWVGAKDGPATHTLKFQMPNGDKILMIVEFGAIGDHDVEDFMRGYEPTRWYLVEADLMVKQVLVYARGRAGRFLSTEEAEPVDYGVDMDCNTPEFGSWLEEMRGRELREGIELFRQAPALLDDGAGGYIVNPAAENLHNLPRDYYANQIAGQPQWYIDRMLLMRAAYNQAGLPVFQKSFSDHNHVAKRELEPDPSRQLLVGLDGGPTLNPAAVIRQRTSLGQWRAIDELYMGHGVGAERFAENFVKLLGERYRPWLTALEKWDRSAPRDEAPILGFVDPSAMGGTDKEAEELTWQQIFQAKTGIPTRPARTNSFTVRRDAVENTFKRRLDGDQPANLISPRCVQLRRGYNAGYRYRKILVQTGDRYTAEVEKNEWSHLCDADQYVILEAGEYETVMGIKARRANGVRQTRAMTDENPRGEWAGGDGEQTRAIMD